MAANEAITIMIIDDHQHLRGGVISAIQSKYKHAEVIDFNSPIEVLHHPHALVPQLIILDINMQRMNGLVASQQLKSKYPRCKILGFSGEDKIPKDANMKWFDGFLFKSNGTELLNAVDCILSGGTYWPESDDSSTVEAFNRFNFTSREKDVMRLIVSGTSNDKIAMQLNVSPLTVKTHRRNIYQKAQVNNAIGLHQFMIAHGIE